MITGLQIREARRLLGWARWRLADKARLALNTVVSAESYSILPSVALESLTKIEAVLTQAGVEFKPENGGDACEVEEGHVRLTGGDPVRKAGAGIGFASRRGWL